jgi:hypothetical protein
MPARKPAGLSKRHSTKAERKAKTAAESAMTPKAELPAKPPAALTGHTVAAKLWKQTINMYGDLDAQIVSMLDQDLLIDYCLIVEQLGEMDQLRTDAMKSWERAETTIKKKAKIADGKEFVRMLMALNHAFDEITKLDARVDIKRKLLLQLRQSLYLTPRSRAGVAPAEKPPEKPKSDMEKLLDEDEVEVKPPRSKK